jgi:hypothetical protein
MSEGDFRDQSASRVINWYQRASTGINEGTNTRPVSSLRSETGALGAAR